jgi:hypothetical protein
LFSSIKSKFVVEYFSTRTSSSVYYSIHLIAEDEPGTTDSPVYIAINEETLAQHTVAFVEQKEWKFNEIEIFRSTPIVENFFNQKDQSL